MPRKKTVQSPAAVPGPTSVFDVDAIVGLDSSGPPSREFAARTMAQGVEWVQFTKAGARVIHATAATGDVVVDTNYQSRPIEPRRLGPAIPDTVGKGSSWVMDRSLAL